MKKFVRNHLELIICNLAFVIFSCWLFWSTFSVIDGNILMGSKVWSDFGSHIPLIRSFSLGSNFPLVEFPLFPGEPIRYHFLFYLLVGWLEKSGLRLDFALNILSALGFTALLSFIYLLAKTLFKSKVVAVMSVILFLFNSSLSFLEYFNKGGTLLGIPTVIDFPSFGPYREGEIVSAFWSLNIFTNQRHFAPAIAFLLALILWVFTQKASARKTNIIALAWGVGIGVLPFFHSSIFVTVYLILGVMFLFFREYRKTIFIVLLTGFVLSLPRILFLGQGASYSPELKFGYLANEGGYSFFEYWFYNLGLSSILIPVGFIVSPLKAKKLFLAFLGLFIIGNSVQFTQEMAGNHKFFNIFLIVGNMFTAYALFKIWNKSFFGKTIIPTLILLLTLSGVIDLFAIKNDPRYTLVDVKNNPDANWIATNTPKESVFLNTSYLFHPANLAGRKLYLGWPYFAMSLGHDTVGRYEKQKEILASLDKSQTCISLDESNIDYVAIDEPKEEIIYDIDFWEANFVKLYDNKETNMRIFETAASCK